LFSRLPEDLYSQVNYNTPHRFSRVLKKAFLAFFNDGLHEMNSRKPLKLLDSKICAIWRYFHVPLKTLLIFLILAAMSVVTSGDWNIKVLFLLTTSVL
jgi:hypothetical protein